MHPGETLAEIPHAVPAGRARWRIPAVWLVPLVAALLAGWLGIKTVLERGPTITIRFKSADGIEAGKTKLKYKDVQIGIVRSVSVSPDLKEVIVKADLAREVEPHLAEDARFWVVRPRIAAGTVSGLETLLSGAYIGVDAGKSGKGQREFVALDAPPVVTVDSPGTPLVLHGASAGSLEVGSPVYFRRLPAGQVTGVELDREGVKVSVFVKAPFDQHVNTNTRFWHASGIDVSVDASGIRVDTQSLVSILIGGIAFDTPPSKVAVARADAATDFRLFENRTHALKNPEIDRLEVTLLFNESVRGLQPGAPVDFRGITVGEVTDLRMRMAADGGEVLVAVRAAIYPSRIQWQGAKPGTAGAPERRRRLIDALVASGMRAQLRHASLVTQQLYVALDFFPAKAAKVNWAASPPELPTQKATLVELESAIGALAAKLDRFPLDELSGDLRQTLQSAARLMDDVDAQAAELAPTLAQARKALASADRLLAGDSPLQTDTRQAMREVARAAQAFRVLADYLERHPEALLVGKKDESVK
jgi:paraquat-inducible protein B